MTKVLSPDTLCSAICYKKFGNSNGFGNIIFGFSFFGEDNEYAGIYRRRPGPNGVTVVKTRFYRSPVSNTAAQDIQRTKYASAVAAWKALSDEEREAWRVIAANKKSQKEPVYKGGWPRKKIQQHRTCFRGYDIFRSDYLLTH